MINLTIANKVEPEFWDVVNSVPDEILKIQGIYNIDLFDLADRYFEAERVADVSIDVNANVDGREPVNFQSEIEKPQLKLRSFYILWKKIKELYGIDNANKCLKAMLCGEIYFHDITKIDIPYCFAFDTSFLMNYGRPYGWLPSKAPKRSSSFIGQLVEITMDLSQCLAGAVGLANILVNLAYFTKNERREMHKLISKYDFVDDALLAISMYAATLNYEGKEFTINNDTDSLYERLLKYYNKNSKTINDNNRLLYEIADAVYNKYVENLLQQFVHVMHNTFRVGGDSPFTNLSIFDSYIIKDMFGDEIYPDMTQAKDNIDEIMTLQKIYAKFYSEGAPTTGKNYRFPVSTVNIKTWTVDDASKGLCSKDDIGKIADTEFFSYICKMNHRRGAFNIHIGEKIASCCRLTSDLADLKNQIKTDSFGNGGISIGSHRVVALNLHRMALIYKENIMNNSTLTFKEVLTEYLKLIEMALVSHKAILKERVDNKFLKFFNIGWQNLNMFFSTIGYTGLWEMSEVLHGKSPAEDLDLYIKDCSTVIDIMEKASKKMSKENDGIAGNVEEIPGENCSPKCAEMDNFYYKKYDWYKPVHLLGNQMIPLYVKVPLFDRLNVEGKLMNMVSGGAILHLNMEETMTDKNYEKFLKMIIEKYHIVHFAINKGTTTCVNNHTSIGIYDKCPVCGEEIYTHTIRVVGFNTDTRKWTKERRDWEFNNRQFYLGTDLFEEL